MRREGSAFQGAGTVFVKELADHISSFRMLMLELLVVLTASAALYEAIDNLRKNTSEDPFLLLRLFTTDQAPLPSFVAILGFLIPLMAIGLGFDTINSEHNRRTLSRILAQPIYRDALLMGKYLAALATIAISLAALWLLVIGLGLLFLGVPPGGEEIVRSLAFLVIAIFYAGVWLSLAMLLSIVFRSAAPAALVALGIWLFFAVLWPMLAPAIAQAIAPPDPRYTLLGLDTPDTAIWTQILSRPLRAHLVLCFSTSCAAPSWELRSRWAKVS
jgi:ABC-2 type transport system permease protein